LGDGPARGPDRVAVDNPEKIAGATPVAPAPITDLVRIKGRL
jgi:hypothetical protein